ncbi:tripartite motif-containing protein 16-like [Salminus brasiliensis]|uniref:tripartite motif-containing protein 16-like n=1 Tax=Salminus brasiliensis TaxID=930266 RepID=UPI003B830EB3
MAEASISVDQDQFCCPVCLDLLKNPVTVPCGHSFCMDCIKGCWDQEDQSGVYSCPQCRETFTPRPVLRRSYFIAEMLEKLKKIELQAASPAGPGDVECDFCTGRKLRAVKSCLTCLASFCEAHLKPHQEVPALKNHKLVKASKQLQEKICSQHDKPIEIYCRTDHSCICYLCTMHEHKGHDTVAAVAETIQKQNELKEIQKKLQQRLQEKEKRLQNLKKEVNTLKCSAQAAVEDSERIFTELIHSIEKKRSEVTKLIRAQEKTELREAEELLEKLEQQISDLKRKNAELNQLSQTEDHISFLQSFQTFCISSEPEDSSSVSVHQQLSFDAVRKSLSDLKERLEQFCIREFSKIPPLEKRSTRPHHSDRKRPDADTSTLFTDWSLNHAGVLQTVSASEPRTRSDFLQYFWRLTLDPNTVNDYLSLSESNREVRFRGLGFQYSEHPERFDSSPQVLSKESVCGRAYWEVEWSGPCVSISVSYKGISRKGGYECLFGRNDQSWSLRCSSPSSLRHKNIGTKLPTSLSSRIGVYVDHSAGTLSFYNISHTMTLIHTVQTTFTQPLHAGLWVDVRSSVKLCDIKEKLREKQFRNFQLN